MSHKGTTDTLHTVTESGKEEKINQGVLQHQISNEILVRVVLLSEWTLGGIQYHISDGRLDGGGSTLGVKNTMAHGKLCACTPADVRSARAGG